jgi:hypothetical protein
MTAAGDDDAGVTRADDEDPGAAGIEKWRT